MRFAHLKRILKLARLRLRGPRDAQDEFVLAATAQNLRRLATLVARPPPAQALRIAKRKSCVESVGVGGKPHRSKMNRANDIIGHSDFCNKICQKQTSTERPVAHS